MSEPRKKQRLPITAQIRFNVFKRDGFKCVYCGMPGTHCILEVDHVVPVAEGGTNDLSNLAACCADCNSGKGSSVIPIDNLPDILAQRMEDEDRAYRGMVAMMVLARLCDPPLQDLSPWVVKMQTHALALGFSGMAAFVDSVRQIDGLTNEERCNRLDSMLNDYIGSDDDGDEIEMECDNAA